MIVSLNQDAGHSGAQYFVGRFDGVRFELEPGWESRARWLDSGADFFAPQSWSNIPATDARRIVIAWAANWRYASSMPTHPARGSMSLPRSLSLVRTTQSISLRQQPIIELQSLRQRCGTAQKVRARSDDLDLAPFGLVGAGHEFTVDLDMGTAQQVVFTLADAAGYRTLLVVDSAAKEVCIDRTCAGPHFHDAFSGRRTARVGLADARIRLHVFVDRSILEVFVDDGMQTMTERFFPGNGQLRWSVRAIGGEATLLDLTSWQLDIDTAAGNVVPLPVGRVRAPDRP
jgi:fructan beta-fructosidase